MTPLHFRVETHNYDHTICVTGEGVAPSGGQWRTSVTSEEVWDVRRRRELVVSMQADLRRQYAAEWASHASSGQQRNACHNRQPFHASQAVQDGWTSATMDPVGLASTRRPRIVSVPFRMSAACEYIKSDLGQADEGCEGCSWRES